VQSKCLVIIVTCGKQWGKENEQYKSCTKEKSQPHREAKHKGEIRGDTVKERTAHGGGSESHLVMAGKVVNGGRLGIQVGRKGEN